MTLKKVIMCAEKLPTVFKQQLLTVIEMTQSLIIASVQETLYLKKKRLIVEFIAYSLVADTGIHTGASPSSI